MADQGEKLPDTSLTGSRGRGMEGVSKVAYFETTQFMILMGFPSKPWYSFFTWMFLILSICNQVLNMVADWQHAGDVAEIGVVLSAKDLYQDMR